MSTRPVTARLRHPDRFFLGGEWVEPSSRARIDVHDSATEEVFLSVAEAQVEDVDRAVAAARTAFDDGPWPRLAHAERAEWLGRIADMEDEVRAARGDVDPRVRRAARDGEARRARTGADLPLPRGARCDVPVGGAARHVGREARVAGARAGRRGRRDHPVERAERAHCAQDRTRAPRRLHRDPQGIAGGAVGGVSACGDLRGDRAAAGRRQRRHGGPRGLERLVRHPGVDKISFTGSTAAGRRIGAICGERIARCTLELGASRRRSSSTTTTSTPPRRRSRRARAR